MFWINLRRDPKHTFRGTIGIDDVSNRDTWMLLKYSILKETVVDGLPEPKEENAPIVVHKTLEELQDMRDIAHIENMKGEQQLK